MCFCLYKMHQVCFGGGGLGRADSSHGGCLPWCHPRSPAREKSGYKSLFSSFFPCKAIVIFPEKQKCRALFWPHATATGKADQCMQGSGCSPKSSFIEGVNTLRVISSHSWAFSCFHTSFGGFAEALHPRFSIYCLLEVGELKTPRYWSSSSIQRASRGKSECQRRCT